MDEKIIVEYTPDKMLGIASFQEGQEEGQKLTKEEITRAINARGIVYGLDTVLLEEIYTERKYNYKYIIAKGEMPVKGENATIEYTFDLEALNHLKPTRNEDGTVDFKNLNIIKNVEDGKVLAVKTPSTLGEEGRNIFGEAVKAIPGKDAKFPRGKNTGIAEDGLSLLASKEGKLCYEGGSISISDVFIVEGDVDSSTGNIDFVGSVIVNGNVKSGYTIKAGGSIEIRGSIEAAELICEEDVVVWYGIQGMNKGVVKAKGNVIAKFIQNAIVEAGKEIVAEAIMHSEVAGMSVCSNDGKGLIVGGKIIAANQVSANTIGSYMATLTDIQIGIPTQVLSEYNQVREQREQLMKDLEKLSQSISYLTVKRDVESEKKKSLLTQMLLSRKALEGSLSKIDERYEALAEKVANTQRADIKVRNIMYPGVKVTIGNAIKYIKEDIHYCIIEKEGGDIVTKPL